ncbi:putative oxido DltE [Cyphellophora attinorum]|uniref:Putative oxido DltE n=1 Tax=Cyphellophora attinorum TaxID=1664694 RepID=A0A0N1HB00_9EURO|nr:putative oxido DltE [Phialophora attinorum]KPI41137.1 putative oxido DltE [Phialophora attinorum]
MDNSDLASLSKHVQTLITKYPDINAVWLNAGIQYSYSFADPINGSKHTDEAIIREITVNLTAHTILARHFVPFLLTQKFETVLMLTSSGIAYLPLSQFPVYGATKAATHHLCCAMRDQLADTNVRVLELATPYVATDLDKEHKEASKGAPPPMPLEEYTDKVFEILDGSEAKELKEVGVGFAQMGVGKWREAFGPVLEGIGSKA